MKSAHYQAQRNIAFLCFDDDRFARRAYPGTDDGDKYGSGRIIRGYATEKARDLFDGVGSDLVGDVHEARIWRDADHHRFADRHGIIGYRSLS